MNSVKQLVRDTDKSFYLIYSSVNDLVRHSVRTSTNKSFLIRVSIKDLIRDSIEEYK